MTTPITSKDNPRVKQAYLLMKHARNRREERKFVLEGLRLIRDAVQRGARLEYVLYEPKQADYDLIAQLQERKVGLHPITEDILRHLSDTQQPQGMIAVAPIPVPPLPKAPRAALVLDAVRDPGNLGTILRSAAAAACDVALLSLDCADPYSPKALRGGMGAHFRLPIVEADWGEMAGYLDGVAVYLADGRAERAYTDVDFCQRWALVIGNEAHGARRAARLKPTPIAIPMAADSESLNAAAACAVILFEAARQRRLG